MRLAAATLFLLLSGGLAFAQAVQSNHIGDFRDWSVFVGQDPALRCADARIQD